ncbi:MAG TPA: TIM-barrel domain-containing protein [Chitinophagaceae bacterium]|nr:TIM-barrel domain-containing protein [Chitinophagaceae bacterium]
MFIYVCVSFNLSAQINIGQYEGDFSKSKNEISFSATNAKVKLNFCTPAMFRVRVSWDGHFNEAEHWMVTKYQWNPVDIQTVNQEDDLQIRTTDLKIVIHKNPIRIDVYTTEGKLLSSESNTAMTRNGAVKKGNVVKCSKFLQPDEHFFGFGERMDFLDRRGKKVSLNVGRGESDSGHLKGAYNTLKANYSPIPFFMSTKGYGLFFHNSNKTTWDMGSTSSNSYSFAAVNGELDYYFIYGPKFPAILDEYTELTGKSPLLPKFALGLQFGTYSGGTWGHEKHASPAYVLALVKEFREMGIPLDILFLDSTWRIFAEGGHGATTFEWRDAFTNPKEMFDSLYAMHLHMVGLHIRSRLDNGPKYHLLKDAQKAGMTYPEQGHQGEFPNYFDSTAVDWWWNNAVMKVASQGAMFFKTDEGSAFGRKANESDKRGPTDSLALTLHNIFPLAYTGAAFNEFQKYNGIRGMNQTREGYAGIQRFPYIFAGDWPSQWQFFEPVIKAGLNIGVSGVGYWTHCMGGFEGKADPELYIRWCQFGMFSPVAMAFGMDHPGYKEPWNYGEKALKNFKKYDSLRYSLIPYIYSTAYENHETGMPIIRALVLHYQNDHNVYDITDQYMFGDNMMVCPVTEKGARSRVIYLPEGSWVNYWTGEKYEGKQYITVLCPLLQIPIFIKGGGIIPTQNVMQYIGEKPVDAITLNIYPDGRSSFDLYDDDGLSLKYQKGNYAITKITSEKLEQAIDVEIAKPEGKYSVEERKYKLKIHLNQSPISVIDNGDPMSQSDLNNKKGWYFDSENKILWVYPKETSKKNINIKVNF